MRTENMPTTNQKPEETTLADKIPPTVAAGFEKAASSMGNAAIGAFNPNQQEFPHLLGGGMNSHSS